MTNLNKFKKSSEPGILSGIPDYQLSRLNPSANKIWGCLLHLSVNMWKEHFSDLQLSELLWSDALQKMAKESLNMVVIDLGDAIKYESHPEIAVNNAWTTTRLRNELEKCRKMGLEPIPKLNFSTCHDTWLGVYSRMVSTEKYYSVCSDLIEEVVDLFDKPRFFHLGCDEEVAAYQSTYDYIVERQHDLWWHDFYFLTGEVEKGGSRPWIWSDYLWHHPDLFFKNMPKSVVQSNWYYGDDFNEKTNKVVNAYLELEAHGYDQIPTGSNIEKGMEKNIMNNVQFCDEHIPDPRLLGFLQTPWKYTLEENREHIFESIEMTGKAKNWFDKNHQ